MLPARRQLQGAEPLDFPGAARTTSRGLGVQVADGPAAADPDVEVIWDMPRWAARSLSHHSCRAAD